MAPLKSKEQERDPWSWVHNSDPLNITDENVKTAYRINIAPCENKLHKRNCRANPYCLARLGEEKWSDEKNFGGDQINDPEKERRREGAYVGLKNLGATCYVNSLLQLWFHNLNFRKAIFTWDPLKEPETPHNVAIAEEKQILKHLQAVFALMQYGKKRFVDPTDFITSLRLDTSIQQDAQEFSKLFLSKLESLLSYQSQKEVRDLIKDNFCGEYEYVTQCMKCQMESKRPSKFYELDLNIIKGHKTIQDCLKDFMKIEILEGDNKYFCAVCKEKQDAQRFISLTELPPILNLQLMRFLYDKNTGLKKKLNTAIQFPEKLNMSEFCPNAKGGLEYTLSAVLVHGGRSANSGHYVALICDSATGTWYKFNDESVEKIDAKKLKFAIEDDCEDGSKKNKVQRAPPKGSYHSINAYMLVYTRNDTVAVPSSQDDSCRVENWELPPHLEQFVFEQNQQFENWVAEIKKYNDATVGRSLSQQDEMISMITMLPVDSDTEDFDAVPTSCLSQWLSDPDSECTIDNLRLTCKHAKLDPSEVSDVKYINSEIAEKLFERYGGTHRFRSCEFQCRECVTAKCFKIRVKSKTAEEGAYIIKRVKNFNSEYDKSYWVGKWSIKSWRRLVLENLQRGVYDSNPISLLSDVHITDEKISKTTQEKENNDLYAADKCHVFQNGTANVCPISSESECDYETSNSRNDLCTSSPVSIESKTNERPLECFQNETSSNLKCTPVDQSTCDMKIEPVIYNMKPSTSFNNAFYQFLEAQKQYSICQKPSNGPMNNIQSDQSGSEVDEKKVNCSVVSRTQLSNGNKSDGSIEQEMKCTQVFNTDETCLSKRKLEEDDDSSNSEMRFNEDLLCLHGNLCIEETSKRRLIPEDVWRIFKKYFPMAKEFASDAVPCSLCKNIASEDEMAKDKYRSKALEEKEHLLDLYHERNRPQLPTASEYDFTLYILSREFYSSWRRFINWKKEPPSSIQNGASLLCPEHGKLLYDLNDGIPQSLIMFVNNTEWNYLSSMYSYDQEISVYSSADGVITTQPSVCEECMNNRIEYEKRAQLSYSNAKIYIQVVKEDPPEESSQPSCDEWRPSKRVKLANVTNATNGSISNICNSSKSANNKLQNNSNSSYNEIHCVDVVSNGSDHANVNGVDNTTDSICCSRNAICGDYVSMNDPIANGNDSNNNNSNSNKLCHNINNGNVNSNGKSSPPYTNACRLPGEQVAVRRSARARRGDKKIEISVSSNLVLLDIKKKILEVMEVIPSDQHLFTADGRELTENATTLADLSIFPETVLTLKVDKPCAGDDPDDFTISREREQGFVGTILTSGPCLERCGQQQPQSEALS